MKPLREAMQSFFQKEQSEKVCSKHNKHLTIFKVKSKMLGERVTELCDMCETEKLEAETKELALSAELKKMKRLTSEVLRLDSIVPDENLLTATLENFEATTKEQVENKKICLEAIERIKNGQVFNIRLQGKRGTGKSHLAYSILNSLNENGETSSLFIAVDEMLRKIKASFRDKESPYTEDYFVSLLSRVDYLVLDDLGAETGAIRTDKEATDFVQRVLYGITNARQNKVTIVTTNLDIPSLLQLYDEKLVSRLLNNSKEIEFVETKDRRMTKQPF